MSRIKNRLASFPSDPTMKFLQCWFLKQIVFLCGRGVGPPRSPPSLSHPGSGSAMAGFHKGSLRELSHCHHSSHPQGVHGLVTLKERVESCRGSSVSVTKTYGSSFDVFDDRVYADSLVSVYQPTHRRTANPFT